MTTAFSPHGGLIIVTARLWGPAGDAYVRLALDTGATSTLIRPAHLVYLGYDPGKVARRVRMTTGSGVEYVPRSDDVTRGPIPGTGARVAEQHGGLRQPLRDAGSSRLPGGLDVSRQSRKHGEQRSDREESAAAPVRPAAGGPRARRRGADDVGCRAGRRGGGIADAAADRVSTLAQG